jgi:hypothetical protein
LGLRLGTREENIFQKGGSLKNIVVTSILSLFFALFSSSVMSAEGKNLKCQEAVATVVQMTKVVEQLSQVEWRFLQEGKIKQARRIGNQKQAALKSKDQIKGIVHTSCMSYISQR